MKYIDNLNEQAKVSGWDTFSAWESSIQAEKAGLAYQSPCWEGVYQAFYRP